MSGRFDTSSRPFWRFREKHQTASDLHFSWGAIEPLIQGILRQSYGQNSISGLHKIGNRPPKSFYAIPLLHIRDQLCRATTLFDRYLERLDLV